MANRRTQTDSKKRLQLSAQPLVGSSRIDERTSKRSQKSKAVVAMVLACELTQLVTLNSAFGFTAQAGFSASTSGGIQTYSSSSGSSDPVGCLTTSWFVGLLAGLLGSDDQAKGAFNGQVLGSIAGVALCTDVVKSDDSGGRSSRNRLSREERLESNRRERQQWHSEWREELDERRQARLNRREEARQARLSDSSGLARRRRERIERVRRIEDARSSATFSDGESMRSLFRVSNVEAIADAIQNSRHYGEIRGTKKPSWFSRLLHGELGNSHNSSAQVEPAQMELIQFGREGVHYVSDLNEPASPEPSPECVTVVRRESLFSRATRTTLYCDAPEGRDELAYAQVIELYSMVNEGAYMISLKGYADVPITIPNKVGDRIDGFTTVRGPFYWYKSGNIPIRPALSSGQTNQNQNVVPRVSNPNFIPNCNAGSNVRIDQQPIAWMPEHSFQALVSDIHTWANLNRAPDAAFRISNILYVLRENMNGQNSFAKFCAAPESGRVRSRFILTANQAQRLIEQTIKTDLRLDVAIAGAPGSEAREVIERILDNADPAFAHSARAQR